VPLLRTYLLVWDDSERNSVKGWIRVAERAVKSHPRHEHVELPESSASALSLISQLINACIVGVRPKSSRFTCRIEQGFYMFTEGAQACRF
jgi:hypothetical protein